jgi:hypothetical protein
MQHFRQKDLFKNQLKQLIWKRTPTPKLSIFSFSCEMVHNVLQLIEL